MQIMELKWIRILGLIPVITLILPFVHCSDNMHFMPALECYDGYGRPQKCIPEFINAAYQIEIEASNTCGESGEQTFCVQTGYSNRKSCEVCRPGNHHPRYLTDLHDPHNPTWWQSETMYEGIQGTQVNLILHLGKSFDITYIRLVFNSPRPESFAIYKRMVQNGPWIPYQYYSATCRSTYGQPDFNFIKKGENESRALCTSEYSDISPLRLGNVAFSSLEGRPSATNFENSPALQDWVTATDIKITLDRLNTFGDEVFGDSQVLKSYFYSIADIAVGARCKCNGHASKCVLSTGLHGERQLVCQCKHNTDGPDCERCLPNYNDVEWRRATSKDVNECKPCNCNHYSEKCFFDRQLYNATGHGGHCIDCRDNRDGANCEKCKENYYMREDGYCIHCGCDAVGSRSLQCNSEGKCQCKPGVTGEKCDRCEVNYYHFSTHGCQSCGCDPRGSLDNVPSCDPETGICACKVNVEGKQCRECKPGFFNLALDNKFGCTPCFCYGHTSECKSADGYSIVSITSNFNKHKERWQAVNSFNQFQDLKYNQYSQTVGAITGPNDNVYFSAADRFLGDQRASYNRLMKFKLQLAGQIGPNPSSQDIILEGAGTKVSLPIFAQGNDMPDQQMREYVFRLHEHPEYSWQPTQSARGYLSILSNLTSIKIRASYSSQGEAILDDFELQTAHRGAAGQPAKWIEQCTCPDGYVGQFCESCSPGYRHSPAKGGPFMPCIPCDCNRHAQMCDPETGRCICNHNTAGDTCDQCAKGYYGNALSGTPNDCKPCPCPNNGSCLEMADGSVMCLDCPVGYFGHRCEQCSDGYYGDPIGIVYGENLPCKACDCNGNVDPNAVGNCNRTTGECVKCIYNTAGSHCESCLEGYFGNPLALPHGKCQQCSCYPPGTEQTLNGISVCEQLTGNCQCKLHVTGQNCDECQPGYFNLDSGNGCESCDCDPVGSHNITCDRNSGQCYCKPGVTGLRCDKCAAYQYGFSSLGCKPCDCDESGSKSLQCDQFGQCPCNDNVEGRQCNRCKENKYDRHQGCLNCPHCYDLVQDAANAHRAKLLNLSQTLESITQTPAVNDQDFEAKLKRVQSKVDILLDDAKAGAGGDGLTLVEHMNDLRDRLQKIETTLNDSAKLQLLADIEVEKAGNSTNLAEETILNARNLLTNALNLLKTDGNQALNNAQNKFDHIGSQSNQISGISREARGLADQLESTSSYDLNSAKEANASAAGAYELALNTLNLQKQMENELTSEMQLTMDQAKKELNETSRQTKQALKNSKDAYDTSLALFTSVDSMKIPDIDTEKLRKEATGAHDQALRLEERVNALVEDKSIFNDFAVHGQLADVMKERALTQDEDAQASYKHVNESYTIARQAVASGDSILHNANKTYHTLAGFQSKVPDLTAQAKNALQNVSQIQYEISNAESMIATAENALHGADKDAADALENALKSQDKYAAQASKEAAFIRRKANDTKVNARNLRGEVDQLNGRVAVTSSKIDKLEGSLEKDEKTIEGAKKKVGEAKADSIGTKNIVEKAMNEVQVIIEDLNNLRDIDPNELHNLEKRLNDTETQLRESNLGGRLEALAEMKNRQNQLINDYENQIKGLQLEVENIATIADALPSDCYKRSRLEP